MLAVGVSKAKKRRLYQKIAPSATLLLGAEFEIPVHFYDTIPSGGQYEQIDLEHVITVCRERQQALHCVEGISMMDSDDIKQKSQCLFEKLKTLKTLNFYKPTEKQRTDDNMSHWMLRSAYCRTPDLKSWFMKNEVDLFRYRFDRLLKEDRKKFYEINKLSFPEVDRAEIIKKRDKLRSLKVVAGRNGEVEKMEWYKIPFQQVTSLVRNRAVYMERGFAFVPEEALTEFVVGKFRASLSKWLAILAKKRDLLFSDESERLEPILKSFGQFLSLEHDYSSEAGRLTPNTIEPVSKKSFPPCARQLLDALKVDKKLKHDGRIHIWGFLKAGGMTVEDAMKWTFSTMSAYQNPEKEFGYNVRHAWGREGGGKGIGSYGCINKIKSLPAEGQYHGCPFKHQKNLKGQLRSWGIQKDSDVNDIAKMANDGKYQHACVCYFKKSHKIVEIEELVPITISHPNHYFDQSYDWNRGEHSHQKRDQITTQSQSSTQSYIPEWKTAAPMSQAEKDQMDFDNDTETDQIVSQMQT